MSNKAFSLIELIVWITISMLLMVSVWVFISSGMKNIFAWQKVLENISDFTNFTDNLNKNIHLIQSGSFSPTNTPSWILFKRWQNFSDWWFSYIWTQILDNIYCNSGAEDTKTNHIFIKNFIPFEESWEDIFTDYTWVLSSTETNIWWKIYRSFQKEHRIAVKNWTQRDTIIWKTIFWDKFIEWANPKDIYLNSPTWLDTDWTNLYISDTLNHRILYLDNSNKIHLLLDESDGLNEPTWLYYNDSSLYIANSWYGEILKYSSTSQASNSTLTLTWVTVNSINKIEISFFNQDGTNKNIAWPINKNDVTFSNISKNDDYIWITANKLQYYFVNYNWVDYSEPSCTWTEERLVWWNPVKCKSTWTWTTSTYHSKNLVNEIININNIIPNLSNTWSYYVNLKLFNLATEKYSKYFPYFTQSDNDLTTKNDNILTVLYSWLNYPTWIWWIWPTDFNVFWDGTYSNLPYTETDNLLNLPIKSLNITNTPNDLLTFILKYYKSYNCYNLDEKIEKTFITNKNLK
jgi:hypothetical protein